MHTVGAAREAYHAAGGSGVVHPTSPTSAYLRGLCLEVVHEYDDEMNVLLTTRFALSIPSLDPRLWLPEAGCFAWSVTLLFPVSLPVLRMGSGQGLVWGWGS